MIERPLVSVCVITYNSEKYIIEALNSIKEQTYNNIELIISDDYSKDNTVILCENWLSKNKTLFHNVLLITSNINTGTSANCNRAFKNANGTWIKGLGGDDALKPNCIKDNISFISNNPNALIVHSAFDQYNEFITSENYIGKRSFRNHPIAVDNIGSCKQFKILLNACFVNTPTLFVSKSLMKRCSYFDESIKYIEDWPLYIKLTKNNISIYYFDNSTVNYRVRADSLCNEKNKSKIFNNHFIRERPVYEFYIFPEIGLYKKIAYNYIYFLKLLFLKFRINEMRNINFILYRILLMPYSLFYKYVNYKMNYIYDIDAKNKRYNKKN